MAVDTATRTRADEIRRYVELDALSSFVSGLAEEFSVGDKSLPDALREAAWDTLMVTDGTTYGELFELLNRLWPEGQDGTAEQQIAQAESCALQARVLAWLGTDDARAAIAMSTLKAAERAETWAGYARQAMAGEEAD